MNILLIFLGTVSILYDITLIALNPGTFWDIVFSFSHIWFFAGAYLIFTGVYRIRMHHSFWQTWKKWIKITVVCVVSLAAIISMINMIFILTPEILEPDEKVDQVILLGGGIDKDGKLPKSVLTRVEKTAEYLKLNPEAVCVVSGGTLHWLPYAEAPELKNQLVKRGIAAERILVEDQAKDTIQNLKYSSKLLAEYKSTTIQEILNTPTALVSTHYHLKRAELLAHRMGFKNIKGIGAACPAIYVPHSYVREICAYVKLNLRILLTGEPKRLSDQARQ